MGKERLYHLGSNRSSTKKGKTTSSRGQIRDGSSSSSTSTRTSSTSFSGCMKAIFQLFDLHQFHFPNLHPQRPPSSSSSFNPPHDFFLPQLQPPIHLKGVEAPRNSLEMDDTRFMGAPTSVSSNSTIKQGDTFKIPMGGIQIKTSGHTRSSRRTTDLNGLSSSECLYSSSSSSPAGTKTPTLVARLMGLDLLPETSSPRPSSSSSVTNLSSSKSQLHQRVQNPRKKQKNDDVMMASLSLPNTPRTSSARRSDVVDQRFSLQINKENNNNELATSQEFEFSKFLITKIAAADRRRKGDETMIPGHYAKQIVQQFKENVSRRIGRDITNTVETNRSEQRRDQHVVLLKSKKTPSSNIGDYHDHDQSTAPNSCSPRLRFLEIKNKTSHSPEFSTSPLSPFTDTAQSKSATVATSKPKAQTAPPKEEQQQIITQQSPSQKCNKIDSEMLYHVRPKKPLVRSKKEEESFVRSSSAKSSTRANANHLLEKKKCKQTPLSNVSTILSVKKGPSPPATRLPQQQDERKQYAQSSKVFDDTPKVFDDTPLSRKSTKLPSCSRQPYKQEPNNITTVTDINSNSGTTTVSSTTGSDELIEYISRILECTGIHKFTPVSFTKWYSPSHPLDPSLFHNLRFSYPKLELNCDEKLVFDVVDELLAEILRPLTNLKPWVNWISRNDHILMYGRQLIDTLFARIRSFPSADCRVLEDIDAVVEKDLGSGRERLSSAVAAFEEEGDAIVIEIEGDILDTLVHEMVVAMVVLRK